MPSWSSRNDEDQCRDGEARPSAHRVGDGPSGTPAPTSFTIGGCVIAVAALDPGVVLDAAAIHEGRLLLRFLPDYRLWPGLRLRVAVSIDSAAPVEVLASWSRTLSITVEGE